jgi:hypothetical protein
MKKIIVRSYTRRTKKGLIRVRRHTRNMVFKFKKRTPIWVTSDGAIFFSELLARDYARDRGLTYKKDYMKGTYKIVGE